MSATGEGTKLETERHDFVNNNIIIPIYTSVFVYLTIQDEFSNSIHKRLSIYFLRWLPFVIQSNSQIVGFPFGFFLLFLFKSRKWFCNNWNKGMLTAFFSFDVVVKRISGDMYLSTKETGYIRSLQNGLFL